MASRENQTFQITIILLAMLSIVLAVSTYMLYRNLTDATLAEESARNAATDARAIATRTQGEMNQIKVMVGSAETDDIATVQQGYDTIMTAFAESLPEESGNQSYRGLVELLMSEMDKQHERLTAQDGEFKRLEADRAGDKKKYETSVADAQKAQKDAEEKLAADRQQFKTTTDGMVQRNMALVADLKQIKTKEDDAVAEKDATIADLQGTNEDLRRQIVILAKKVDDFEVVDSAVSHGNITWVSNSIGTVYINLGEADRLRPQTTFSIFDKSVGNVGDAKPKGSVEVITILGPHAAEARITDDSITDPILSGDQVFSAVWRPGQQTHFALAGFMDLDGDGASDRDFVREVIRLQGGVIDAELLDDGTITGKMSVDTTYFVVGDTGKLAQGPDPKERNAILANYAKLRSEANDKGVSLISTTRLLDLLGWKGKPHTVVLPRKAGDGRFRTRQPPQPSGAGEL